jgi:hypothetical protein
MLNVSYRSEENRDLGCSRAACCGQRLEIREWKERKIGENYVGKDLRFFKFRSVGVGPSGELL